MASKPEDIDLDINVEGVPSNDAHQDNHDQIDTKNVSDESTEVNIEESGDKNAAIPTQQRYEDEQLSLVQYSQKGRFKSLKARTFAISFALLFFCILNACFWVIWWFTDGLAAAFCSAEDCGDDLGYYPERGVAASITVFFGILFMIPAIFHGIIVAVIRGHNQIGKCPLIANVIGVLLIFCGFCAWISSLPQNTAELKAYFAYFFGEYALICGHAIILSLDNVEAGFLDDIKKRALFMSSGLFAVFGFIIFIGRAVYSNKGAGGAPKEENAVIAAGFFLVSVSSMIRIGIVYGKQNYQGANDLFSKFVCALMAIGGIILVIGYWSLAASKYMFTDDFAEEARLVGVSFFFAIMIAVNVMDMAFAKIVQHV